MPPPNRTVHRPTVNKPVPQRAGHAPSYTDTWAKPTSGSNITAPTSRSALTSTKSNVPGINLKKEHVPPKPQPPRGNSFTTKKATKPLPGAKLRPLRSNTYDRQSDGIINTWDPNNRSLHVQNKRVVAVTGGKAKLNSQPGSVASVRTDQVTTASRSSSVSSVKPVLPRISNTASPTKIQSSEPPAEMEESTTAQNRKEKEMEALAELNQQAKDLENQIKAAMTGLGGRPKSAEKENPDGPEAKKVEGESEARVQTAARKRDVRTAKLRQAVEAETKQTDQITDYYMPDWYKNPLIKPPAMKGGIIIFCLTEPSFVQSLTEKIETMVFYQLANIVFVKDIKKFMEDAVEQSLLTLAYFPADKAQSTSGDPPSIEGQQSTEEQPSTEDRPPTVEEQKHYEALPPSLSKELAEKANSVAGKTWYISSLHNPDVYHLDTTLLTSPKEEEMIQTIHAEIDYREYCAGIAQSLSIKSVNTVDEIEAAVIKAQKRKVNIQKQERALHPHYYIEPYETDDVWNHVNLCHTLPESAFARDDLLNQLKTSIEGDFSVASSPLVVKGESKTGKTWLCAHIPSLLGDTSLTVVRFCALTRLASTLPNLLRNISKQLHAVYGSPVVPRHVQPSIADLSELFLEILNNISSSNISTEKPLVLVLDGFDKLAAPATDLAEFISHCHGRIPEKTVLVLSLTSPDSDSTEFYDHRRALNAEKIATIRDETLGKELLAWHDTLAGGIESLLEDGDVEDVLRLSPKEFERGISDKFEGHEAIEEALTEDIHNIELLRKSVKMRYDMYQKTIDLVMSHNPELKSKGDDQNKASDENLGPDQESEKKDEDDSNKKSDEESNEKEKAEVDKDEDEEEGKERKEKMKTFFHELSQRIAEFSSVRTRLEKESLADIERIREFDVRNGHICDLISSSSTDTTTEHVVEVNNLTDQEARDYISHLCEGRISDEECKKLLGITETSHNPLLLRLCVNRASLGKTAESMLEFLAKNGKEYWATATENTEEVPVHGLPHVLIACLAYNTPPEIQGKNHGCATAFKDISWAQPTLADFMAMGPSNLHLWIPYGEAGLREEMIQAFKGCMLQVYSQNDFIIDSEAVDTFLRKDFIRKEYNELTERAANMGTCLKTEVFNTATKLMEHYLLEVKHCFVPKDAVAQVATPHQLLDAVYQDFMGPEGAEVGYSRNEYIQQTIATSYAVEHIQETIATSNAGDVRTIHEADTWDELKVIEGKLLPEKFDNGFQRMPVTTSREKGYPQGRRRVLLLTSLEIYITAYLEYFTLGADGDSKDELGAFDIIEILLQYDLFIPILQDYGVDYIANIYGSILEAILRYQELSGHVIQNLLPLELLQNLITKYTPQLRDNSSNFFVLFMSMFNEDSSLASRSAQRLYRRVKHEVNIRNNLHLITILSKTSETQLLSQDTKRFLQRTSNKYASCQCTSNASFILSHNNNNSVKLWELTGEFISAQKFEGKIKAVCPQRKDKCFLAVIETVSEVGQKNASVWRIDRLKNKKLTDIGSKHILSAWFDKDGDKLVLVEQCTVDEIRVIVSIPQSMSVGITEDKAIVVSPIGRTSFMDKSLEVPRKVSDELLELMSKHLESGKKDGENRALTLAEQPVILDNLATLWDDLLEKFDAKDDLVYPMEEIESDIYTTRESVSKMKNVTLHGMTSAGDIVVDCQFSDGTHHVLFYKLKDNKLILKNELDMDDQATMTLMPTDDFVYSDTTHNSGLISWNLPTNDKKIFGNEQSLHVTCLQFEVEEGQILSFTRGQVTVWNAVQKTTESSFTLDKAADKTKKSCEVVAACLQDNWLAIVNREGELTIRFEIRKKMATYHFHEPVDWIDCHVIGDYLYVACHLNGDNPGISFLKYRVSDAPLYELEKYVVRS